MAWSRLFLEVDTRACAGGPVDRGRWLLVEWGKEGASLFYTLSHRGCGALRVNRCLYTPGRYSSGARDRIVWIEMLSEHMLRMVTLNVRSLRSDERVEAVVEFLRTREVHICALQETWWSGSQVLSNKGFTFVLEN